MLSPCLCHVVSVSVSCSHRVCPCNHGVCVMLSPCLCHVVTVSVSCSHRVCVMLSPCLCHVVTVSGSCCHRVWVMLSPCLCHVVTLSVHVITVSVHVVTVSVHVVTVPVSCSHRVCPRCQRFLLFMGAKSLDPFNLRLLPPPPAEVFVLIHKADAHQLHQIPNLLRLKEEERVQFVVYQDVMDVKHRQYTPILSRGGMLVADDMALFSVNPGQYNSACAVVNVKSTACSVFTRAVVSGFDSLRVSLIIFTDIGTSCSSLICV